MSSGSPPPAARGRWRPSPLGLAIGGLAGVLARDLDLPALVSYWGDRTPLVVAVAVLGALLWPTRRLRWAVIAGTAFLSVVWTAVAFTPVTGWMAAGLARRDAVGPADAVFVLASRLQADGEPTTAAMNRLVHGLMLLAEGRAPRLIVSELPAPHPSHAALARAWIGRLGLQREVHAVGPVRSTRDEAVAVAALCRASGWRRLLVVTSPTHSRRASLALEREGIEVASSPSVETRFDLENLDRPSERLEAFGSLVHERVGLLVYGRRGWLAGH